MRNGYDLVRDIWSIIASSDYFSIEATGGRMWEIRRGILILWGADHGIFLNSLIVAFNVTIACCVVGVIEEHGSFFGLNVDDVIGLPFRTYDQLYEQGGSCAVVQAYIKDTDEIDEVAETLKDNLGDDYFVVSPSAALDVQKQVTGTIQAVLGGIAAISMFVAGIGIVNTMAISVNERTKEIGTMKAIGAKSTDVLFLFLSEALYTGVIGGIIGVTLGFAIGKLVGRYIGLPVEVNYMLAVGTLVFALFTSLVSGASPAWNAAKMNPVEALRRE